MKYFVSFGTDHQSIFLCQQDSYKTRLLESVLHNLKFLTFVTQLNLHIIFYEVVSWSPLYMVGKSRVGCTGVVGFNKIKYSNNPSYYYVSPKQDPTKIQRNFNFVCCLYIWRRYYYHWLDRKHENICVQYLIII